MPIEMAATPLPDLTLYTRPGCGLCAEARDLLQGLLEDRAAHGRPIAHLRERDIETDPALERDLFDRIPVVELRGRRLELAISAAKLRRFLADGLDSVLA
jgi:glutaredoxin